MVIGIFPNSQCHAQLSRKTTCYLEPQEYIEYKHNKGIVLKGLYLCIQTLSLHCPQETHRQNAVTIVVNVFFSFFAR